MAFRLAPPVLLESARVGRHVPAVRLRLRAVPLLPVLSRHCPEEGLLVLARNDAVGTVDLDGVAVEQPLSVSYGPCVRPLRCPAASLPRTHLPASVVETHAARRNARK